MGGASFERRCPARLARLDPRPRRRLMPLRSDAPAQHVAQGFELEPELLELGPLLGVERPALPLARRLGRSRRGGLGRPAVIRQRPHAGLAQQLLHAPNRVAFAVEQAADVAQELDVLGPVVAASAAPLQRLDLTEFRLPEAKHMLGHVDLLGDLPDGAEGVRGLAAAAPGLDRIAALGHRAQRPVCAFAALSDWLMRSLSTWDARNTRTRRGGIGTSSPVFGLRPMRWPFERTERLPNDESLTLSPFVKLSATRSSTASTSLIESLRDRPTSRNTASPNCARVTVLPAMASASPGYFYAR